VYIAISNHQSTIDNQQSTQGGGPDISSFSGKIALGHKQTFMKYRQSQE